MGMEQHEVGSVLAGIGAISAPFSFKEGQSSRLNYFARRKLP